MGARYWRTTRHLQHPEYQLQIFLEESLPCMWLCGLPCLIRVMRSNLLINPSRVDVDVPFSDCLWFLELFSVTFWNLLHASTSVIDQKHSYAWRRSSWPPVNSSEAKSIAAEIPLKLVSQVCACTSCISVLFSLATDPDDVSREFVTAFLF